MRLFILILILWSANSFFEYQMRHIDNLNPATQSEYAQKINLIGELNKYERSL
jgi:hypothetical protein